MRLSGQYKMKSKLHVTITMGENEHPSVTFEVEGVYDNVSSTLWGEYKESEDPLRSGNNISKLLNPPSADSRTRLMTDITVASVGPTTSADTLGAFDVSPISKADLFNEITQPILPSQPYQIYGLPLGRRLEMGPLQLEARWDLERPCRQTGEPLSIHGRSDSEKREPKALWDEVAGYWSNPKMADIRRGVAQAASAIFGWEDETFPDINKTPQLLVNKFEDIYLAPPHISAPVVARTDGHRHIESGLILGDKIKCQSEREFDKHASVEFDKAYAFTPIILYGITAFDYSASNAPRMWIELDKATRDGFSLHVQSWKDEMYTMDASWMAIFHPNIHFEHGDVDSLDVLGRKQPQDAVCHVFFKTPYRKEPRVECWLTWITPVKECAIECKVTRITNYGCTIRIGTWGPRYPPFHRVKVSWLAWNSDAKGIQGGTETFIENGIYKKMTPWVANRFTQTPKVFIGINHLSHADLPAGTSVRANIESVDSEGFRWEARPINDSGMDKVGVTYIAIES